jgi:hypothetical protein
MIDVSGVVYSGHLGTGLELSLSVEGMNVCYGHLCWVGTICCRETLCWTDTFR